MPEDISEVFFVAITGTVLILVLVGLLIGYYLFYNSRKKKFLKEKELIRSKYEQAIMESQLEIQEQTFTTISQEIHDNIGQVLSLVRLNLNTLKAPNEKTKIEATDALIGKAIHDLRHLSHRLNTELMTEEGLVKAMQELFNSLERSGQFKVDFQTDCGYFEIEKEKSIILYRICQELTNNIIKHSSASCISVCMTGKTELEQIVIADNGKGFPKGLELPSGLGITNIMARAKMIGMQVHFDSVPDRGTTVTIKTLKNEP
jgi:signal transduction histidine kinase